MEDRRPAAQMTHKFSRDLGIQPALVGGNTITNQVKNPRTCRPKPHVPRRRRIKDLSSEITQQRNIHYRNQVLYQQGRNKIQKAFSAPGREQISFQCIFSLLVEGALDWSMVSMTSDERPESMSWARSEAEPTISKTQMRVKYCIL